ncbi:MAG: hypothetical protein U0746_13715 [Gemmataceae bacterium]
MLERPASWLRDPEYARNRQRLLATRQTAPGAACVAVFGSSRVVVGVSTEPATNGEPIVANFGHIGGGPLHELLALRRLLADGPKPDAVIVEFWPPFVVDGPLGNEDTRVLPSRLRGSDLAVFHGRFDADWRAARLTPWYGHRYFLLSQLVPVWLLPAHRYDSSWAFVTKPSNVDPDSAVRQTTRSGHDFWPTTSVVTLTSRQAFQELFADCRAAGIRSALVWLPESSEFRAGYTLEIDAAMRAFANELACQQNVPFIDARAWQPDGDFVDGFHLSHIGAVGFTERLRREAARLVTRSEQP